jgi:DegV family protein with EDD domain
MENIAVVTDTTSDIPIQLVNKHKIRVVPLFVGFDGKLYLEGKEITSSRVYEKQKAGIKIYTSTPSVGAFAEVYRDLIENGKKTLIYSIHISSKLSATSNSADQAKRFFPQAKIKVIDSKTAAISLGFIVLEVARAIERGECEERIDSIIDFMIRKNRLFATIENFEYIFRGGRAPFLKKFLSKSIKLKPILTIGSDGKVKLKKFVKNKRNSIVELYNQIRKDPFYTGRKKIGIFYGSDIEPAFELEKMIREDSKIKIDEMILSEVTTVMSAHTGPGIWGVSSCPAISNNKDIFINELKDALKNLSEKSRDALKYISIDLSDRSKSILKDAFKNLSEKSKDIFDDISEKSKDIFDNLSGKSKVVTKDLSERSIVMTKDLSDRGKKTLKDAIKNLSEKSRSASKNLSEKSKKALKDALISLAERIK